MDELIAKFLPRFAALARQRVLVALEIARERRHGSAPQVVHDLHALAGEAGLLGLEQVIGVARRAEEAARRFAASRDDGDARGLHECLVQLERAVAEATDGIES
jgi:HPt (histidine-containing phosphotransfer) domain-containing protein